MDLLPFVDDVGTLSFGEIEQIYRQADTIIDLMDEHALNELLGGTIKDIDELYRVLLSEIHRAVNAPQSGKIQTQAFHYLDHLSASVEETLRIMNFGYFMASALPDFQVNWHHLEWANLVQMWDYLCIIAARDHSKSWTFSYAYPIWKMYRYRKGNQYDRVPLELKLSQKGLLITNEYSLAKEHLANMKDGIEGNDELAEKLKPAGRDGWGKEEVTCKNGARLTIKSAGSKIRGLHPGYIIVDDFLNDSNLYSNEQRLKYIDYFHSVIMNAIVPQGRVTVVGTPFSDLDLYADLKKKPAWKVFEYPAIFPNGTLLFGTRYTFDNLMQKLASQGSIIFSREILVRPVTSESTIFPYKLVSGAFIGMEKYKMVRNRQSFPVQLKRVGIGVDVARSGNVGADYLVITVLGVDQMNRYWLLRQERHQGLRYGQQMGILKRFNRDFRPDVIGIEDNQMQTFLVDGAEDAGMPVVGLTTGKNKYDLKGGLPGMVLLFEQNKFKFPRGDQESINATDILAAELASITWTEKGKLEGVGAHDDTVLSLWKAVQAVNYVGSAFNVSWM